MLLAEIQARCPDCRTCEECGGSFCQEHAYGDPSECTHHDICSGCWPAHCRECRDRADRDPDFARQAQLEGATHDHR